jgi:O-Antigen ligase
MALGQIPYGQPPIARRFPWQPVALAFTAAMLSVFTFAVIANGQVGFLVGLAVAATLTYMAWRWPVQAVTVLVFAVPINRFVMMLIFNVIGSVLALRALQLWDDLLLAVLLARVVDDAFARRQPPRVYLFDLLVITFVGLTALYVFYPGTLTGISILDRVTGFRFDAYFLLAYFVGRGLQLNRSDIRRLLVALIATSTIVGVVAVWQWAMPGTSSSVFDSLGFEEFQRAVGGTGSEVVRSREIAGQTIPRAASLVTGDLALAFYQTFVIPFAAALYIFSKRPQQQIWFGAFAVMMVGVVVLTITRSAVVASLVSLLSVVVVAGAYPRMVALSLAILGVALTFVLLSGITSSTLTGLLSPDEPSTQAHFGAIDTSLDIVMQEPLGRGLTTAGPLSQRHDVAFGITNESWYLQIATEVGLAGSVLFSLILVGATVGAFIPAPRIKDPWLKALTVGAGGAGVGFILVGAVLHVWEVTPLSMLFWMMMGIAHRASDLESEWEGKEQVRL